MKDRLARWAVRGAMRFSMHIYFKKIEVRGLRNLRSAQLRMQQGGASIFAGNHPSGLIDPMVLMTALPGVPMCSVAKYSLFNTPFVGFFVKAMRAIPVAQPYDPGLPPDKQRSATERRAMN